MTPAAIPEIPPITPIVKKYRYVNKLKIEDLCFRIFSLEGLFLFIDFFLMTGFGWVVR